MNYNPNRYTGSPKKKILFRCLIVLASLAVVSALTLAYGNYLKVKAGETAGGDYSGAGRSVGAEGAGNQNTTPTSFSKSESVKSPAVDVSAFTDVNELIVYVNDLYADGATGVTAVLLDRDGYLTYASDAVAQYTHQRPAAMTSQGMLTTLTQTAKALSMRTTAVIYTSADFASEGISSDIETLVCTDAATCGFEEIVAIMPVTSGEINSDTSASILKYIGRLASARSTALLGVAFGDDVYRIPSLSPQIELFASGADFLAIDLGYRFGDAESARTRIAGTVDELAGSFTVYGLRAIFEGSSEDVVKAEIEALADCGFSNYMFTEAVSVKLPSDTEPSTGGDEPGVADEPGTQWIDEPQDPWTYDTQSGWEPEPQVTEYPQAVTDAPQTDAAQDMPDTDGTQA